MTQQPFILLIMSPPLDSGGKDLCSRSNARCLAPIFHHKASGGGSLELPTWPYSSPFPYRFPCLLSFPLPTAFLSLTKCNSWILHFADGRVFCLPHFSCLCPTAWCLPRSSSQPLICLPLSWQPSSLFPACLLLFSSPAITEAALKGTISTVKTEGNSKILPSNPSSSNKFHQTFV